MLDVGYFSELSTTTPKVLVACWNEHCTIKNPQKTIFTRELPVHANRTRCVAKTECSACQLRFGGKVGTMPTLHAKARTR